MGTNYYLKIDVCPHCNREKERLHIGKSSRGWCFALHVDSELGINDLEDWSYRWSVHRNYIEDEYGKSISVEEMLDIIKNRSWRVSPSFDFELNHAELGPNGCIRHRLGAYCIKHGEGTWDCVVGEFS